LWALLDSSGQEIDHRGDPRGAQLWMAFGAVDPAKVGTAVKLGEGVEERGGGRVGLERGRDVVGEVVALRALRGQDDVDPITGSQAAGPPPGRAEYHTPVRADELDDAADTHTVD